MNPNLLNGAGPVRSGPVTDEHLGRAARRAFTNDLVVIIIAVFLILFPYGSLYFSPFQGR